MQQIKLVNRQTLSVFYAFLIVYHIVHNMVSDKRQTDWPILMKPVTQGQQDLVSNLEPITFCIPCRVHPTSVLTDVFQGRF